MQILESQNRCIVAWHLADYLQVTNYNYSLLVILFIYLLPILSSLSYELNILSIILL